MRWWESESHSRRHLSSLSCVWTQKASQITVTCTSPTTKRVEYTSFSAVTCFQVYCFSPGLLLYFMPFVCYRNTCFFRSFFLAFFLFCPLNSSIASRTRARQVHSTFAFVLLRFSAETFSTFEWTVIYAWDKLLYLSSERLLLLLLPLSLSSSDFFLACDLRSQRERERKKIEGKKRSKIKAVKRRVRRGKERERERAFKFSASDGEKSCLIPSGRE